MYVFQKLQSINAHNFMPGITLSKSFQNFQYAYQLPLRLIDLPKQLIEGLSSYSLTENVFCPDLKCPGQRWLIFGLSQS